MRSRSLGASAGLLALALCGCLATTHAAEPIARRDVIYASPDGQELKLDFVRPEGDGPFPLVVLVHSGAWRDGSRAEFRDRQQGISQLGMASAAIDFRLAPAHRFPAQVEDVVAAIRYLVREKDSFRIAPERIALAGLSSGGQLALLAGLRPADDYQVRLIINVSGPTDLRTLTGPAAPMVKDLLGTDDVKAEIAAQASPIAAIRKNGPAVLSLHGDADTLVPIEQAESFHKALRQAGVKETLVKIEGGGHLFQNWPRLHETITTIAAHLRESLQSPAKVAEEASVRQAPRVLRAAETNVGRLVPDVAFTDLAGKAGKLSDYRDKKFLVVACTDIGCPLCLKYAPSLARLEREYKDRGIAFLYVYPNESDSPEKIRKITAERKFIGRSVHDRSGELAAALKAASTTEVFVLDAARTVVYRGAVDDQYGFGYALEQPRERYLAAALNRLLDGQPPVVAATTAPGCDLATEPGAASEFTYHGRIERIVQANCVECHRSQGSAPFALDAYEAVVARRQVIRRVVSGKLMPPWFAAGPAPGEHNPWLNDRSLSSEDQADLLTWLAGDLKRGDPADAPLARTYPGGWSIGQPDRVISLPKPFAVQAEGTMPYQEAEVETSFSEDRWVQALEVRPTDASVVHHVLVMVADGNKQVRETDSFLAIYVPGSSTLVYPDGFAKKIPRGAKLRFQMHYTPNGKATQDQTRLGMIFAKEPPKHEVLVAGVVNARFEIPAGASNFHLEAATPTLAGDERLLAFMPHMHLRGKAARYELVNASGDSELLLDVPRYDFNWQLFYRYAEPHRVGTGSRIRYRGWYDNSDQNPANPNPTKPVHWGPQTADEMHLGYVEYYKE